MISSLHIMTVFKNTDSNNILMIHFGLLLLVPYYSTLDSNVHDFYRKNIYCDSLVMDITIFIIYSFVY